MNNAEKLAAIKHFVEASKMRLQVYCYDPDFEKLAEKIEDLFNSSGNIMIYSCYYMANNSKDVGAELALQKISELLNLVKLIK